MTLIPIRQHPPPAWLLHRAGDIAIRWLRKESVIEQDLLEFVRPRVDLSDDRLQWECEQAIRNYDPCISCSTHFLKLEVDRA